MDQPELDREMEGRKNKVIKITSAKKQELRWLKF